MMNLQSPQDSCDALELIGALPYVEVDKSIAAKSETLSLSLRVLQSW